MNDDVILLRRYAETRDENAFAGLVRNYLPLVYGAALRQLNGATHRAEEVAQSVFTDLARKAETLARRDDLVGWLYTSTHFAAAKLKRAEQRRQQREQEAQTMHEILSDPAADLDWTQLRPVLDEAMHALGERDRDVILQRFFQGRRLAEVGERLGVSEDAARMRIDRALEKLRALLARRQITSTTAALALVLANQPAVALPAHLAASVTSTALASAGAAAPAVSIFQIMSTTKFAAGAAGLVLALAVGSAVHEMRAARATEAALAAANVSLASVTTRLDEAKRQTSDATEAASSLGKELTSDRQSAPAARPAPVPASAAVASASQWDEAKGRTAMRTLEAAHPEVHRALLKSDKAGIAANYRELFAQLKLTPEQADQFATIMMNAQPVDWWGGMKRSSPLGTYQYSFAPTDHPISTEERDVQLQQLLGSDGLEYLREFDRFGPARSFARMVAQSAFDAGEPFTVDQSREFMQAIAATSASYQAGGNAKLADIDLAAVQEQAGKLLSPHQAALVAGAIEQVQFNRSWSTAVRAAGPASNR